MFETLETVGNLSNGPFATLEPLGNLSNGPFVTLETLGNLSNGPFVTLANPRKPFERPVRNVGNPRKPFELYVGEAVDSDDAGPKTMIRCCCCCFLSSVCVVFPRGTCTGPPFPPTKFDIQNYFSKVYSICWLVGYREANRIHNAVSKRHYHRCMFLFVFAQAAPA